MLYLIVFQFEILGFMVVVLMDLWMVFLVLDVDV